MPSPSLPMDQVLYSVQDTTIISEHEGRATLQRVSFSGTGNDPVTTVHDRIDLGAYDDLLCTRPVMDCAGRQYVAVLTRRGSLSVVSTHDGVAQLRSVRDGLEGCAWIVGFAPSPEQERSLALISARDGGLAVVHVSLDGGATAAPVKLPSAVRGSVIAADLARCGTSAKLVVTTLAGEDLLVHAVDWDHVAALAPPVRPEHVTTLALGSVLSSSEPVRQRPETWLFESSRPGMWGPIVTCHAPFFDDQVARHDQIAAIVTRVQASTTDQQLAVAWYDGDGACRIAVVGWEGGARVLARTEVATSLLKHVAPICRLAAADLFHAGTDQLVLAFPGDDARVFLGLLTLAEAGTPALKLESTYVVDVRTSNGNSLADFDFYLGAGIFGTCAGVVQVVGTNQWRWSFGGSPPDIKEGFIECGFVPVDPVRRAFPEMSAGGRGPARMTVSSPPVPFPPEWERLTWSPGFVHQDAALVPFTGDPRFRAFSSGLSGESIVVGPPVLTQAPKYTQIMAIIQAHPFDRRFAENLPSVAFSTTSGSTKGLTVSTDASWTLADDTSVNLGLGALNASHAIHNSYLKSLGRSDDSGLSETVTLHGNLSSTDWMLISEVDYDVWRYPVVRGCATNPTGSELLVIIPSSSRLSTSWVQASDYAWKPRSEVGMLLSYVDLDRDGGHSGDGHVLDNELFPRKSYDVALGPDASSLTFDQSESSTSTLTTHLSLVHAETSHLGMNPATELFSYLPSNFGVTLGSSRSYSEGKAETMHVNLHEGLTISMHSGTVASAQYKYGVTPVIYRHASLGCLMLGWQVQLREGWWHSKLANTPDVCLVRVYPEADDVVQQAFSRAISIVDSAKDDGTFVTDIEVEIFNNSLAPAKDVSCSMHDVSAAFARGWPKDLSKALASAPLLAKVSLDRELKPVERRKVRHAIVSSTKRTDPLHVAVTLSLGLVETAPYWAVGPADRFFHR